METALLLSCLQDIIDDNTPGPMQFALVAHRLSTETPSSASFNLSAIYRM
jgi:hypothetical protein